MQEVKDVLVGCTILATGGGGGLEVGLDAVHLVFKAGKEFKLLEFNEINEKEHYVTTALTGAVSDDAVLPAEVELEMLGHSVKVLEEYLDIEFEGILSSEYGGGSVGEGMAVAAMLCKCFVDCDAAGRAVPMMQQSTYNITNQPMCPFSVTTKFGDAAVVTKVLNDERAEAIARTMAVASGNIVALSDHPIRGDNLKNAVIPSALSYAETVGKAQRKAVENGLDPVQSILKAGGGYLLFKGTVNKDSFWETKDGFTFGKVCIDGIDEFKSQSFHTWYQNEHLISWKNGKPYVTCPDLICVVDNRTGYPITNPDCNEGDEVAVLGFKAPEIWRQGKGFELLSPRYFGYDIDYQPIEIFFE